mmetsp:Transcript_19415/g.63118  ORF Transcript_19415/g.63118 Transcript_19415/m.63118 type:complete len:309 (+) Transcript_19415:507-1433(+)
MAMFVKSDITTPVHMPRTQNGIKSSFPQSSAPAVVSRCVVKTSPSSLSARNARSATAAQMNASHVTFTDQYVATSSSAKRTPPIGDWNAAEMPAATPAVHRSRRSCCMLYPCHGCAQSKSATKRTTNEPMLAPMCTIGPSRPIGSPLAMASARPPSLTSSVRDCITPRIWHPFRKAFVSGIPLAAARGPMYTTSAAEAAMSAVAVPTCDTNAAPHLSSLSKCSVHSRRKSPIASYASVRQKHATATSTATVAMKAPLIALMIHNCCERLPKLKPESRRCNRGDIVFADMLESPAVFTPAIRFSKYSSQ